MGNLHPAGLVAGALLILTVLWEAFETIVFPRRVTRRFRLTRVFYRATWTPYRAIGARLPAGRRRESVVAVYGPISLILLLILWTAGLVLGFALLHWGLGSRLQAPEGLRGYAADLYFAGATLFTLSLGDITPASRLARLLTVLEGGTGLGFFAMVIGYLPVLSQAFSRREVSISLLDARAGSPPSAGEMLIRRGGQGAEAFGQVLHDWDLWAADLLETHISFPQLAYWRSQHDNQSWVAALTMMLDVCALTMTAIERAPGQPERLAFAMARHAAVDLSRVFGLEPLPPREDRLPPEALAGLCASLRAAGIATREGPDVEEKLRRVRATYEPYMNALGEFLLMPLPTWLSPANARDNWQALV
jgi:hypothetical protein